MFNVDSCSNSDVDDVGNCNVMDEWNHDSDKGEEVDIYHLHVRDEDHPVRGCS